MTRQLVRKLPWVLLAAALLPGCDQLSERAGFPDPAKQEAEGKAIGGACRHAGRGLEDCYRLNKYASKSAVYAGWKEMNEYMIKNNMQAVKPSLPDVSAMLPSLKKKKVDDEAGDSETDKPGKEAHGEAADKAPEKSAAKGH